MKAPFKDFLKTSDHAFGASILALALSVPLVERYPQAHTSITFVFVGFAFYFYRRKKIRSKLIQNILRSSPTMIHIYNLNNHHVTIMTPETLASLGFAARDNFIGNPLSTSCAVHSEDQNKLVQHFASYKKEPQSPAEPVEFRFMRKDGSYAHLRMKSIVFSKDLNNNAEDLLCFTEDFSQEHRLANEVEAQRIASYNNDKIMALGEMAGGVAHEINNPLAIISGHTQTIRLKNLRERLSTEELLKSLDKIDNSAQRIGKVVNALKIIACDGLEDDFVSIRVRALVDDVKMFWAERLSNQKIEFFIDAFDEELCVKGRPVQLILVLINLLSNSFHAVREHSESWIRIKILAQNECAEIHIIDSGNGISAEYRHKLFDPFFTTRVVGEGRGLGLSVSASIAKLHGGSLSLNLTERNTCFVLKLPKWNALSKAA